MTTVPASPAPTGPNITNLDTTSLETSFQVVGDAMNQIGSTTTIKSEFTIATTRKRPNGSCNGQSS